MRVLVCLVAVLAITASANAGLNSGVIANFEDGLAGFELPLLPPLGSAARSLNVDNPLDYHVDITMASGDAGGYEMILYDLEEGVWGGPLTTHLTFAFKGDSSNPADVGMQMILSGIGDTGTYSGITGYDLQSEEWQTITVASDGNWEKDWYELGWDLFNIPAGQSVNFSIDDIVLVPEPATMLLLGLGGLFLRRK